MQHSETLAKLADALAKAQGEIKGAKKDSVNPHFKARYADLESTWEACRGPLSKHGLAVVQMPYSTDGRVGVHTLLMHSSGEFIKGDIDVAMAQSTNPQNAGSILTYLRRYALQGAVGIAPEDDDGNAASPKPASVPAAGPSPAPAPATASDPHPPTGVDALRKKLDNYAHEAADLGLFPTPGDAIYAWTKYVKDGKEHGFKFTGGLKQEWKLKAAIIAAEKTLQVVDPVPLTTGEEDDVPF